MAKKTADSAIEEYDGDAEPKTGGALSILWGHPQWGDAKEIPFHCYAPAI